MTEFVDRDADRSASGRNRRVPEYSFVSPRENRRSSIIDHLPSFKDLVTILSNPERKFSCVPVRTIEEVWDNPLEVAVIQTPVVELSDTDLTYLKELSFDDIPSSWGGLNFSNCDESPARVKSGVKIQFPFTVDPRLDASELISERLGDLLFVEKSSFRAFHHDLEEEGHSFVTHISGRKLWMFCALSSLSQELDRAARVRRTALSGTIRLLDSLKPTRAKQIFWTIVAPGCTIYFPYGFLHSVWTEVEQANCSCICTVERNISDEWCNRQRKLASDRTAVGKSRKEYKSSTE